MDSEEKRELLEFLRAGRHAVGVALNGVDDGLACRMPPSGGWTILQCAEHMAITEAYLAARLEASHPAEHSHENRTREARILERATNRARPIVAPELSHPTGRYASLADAVSALDTARAQVLRWVEGFEDDPRCWITDHPMFTGPVNCFEMLLMIAAHPGRHAKQIMEIRAALGNPG